MKIPYKKRLPTENDSSTRHDTSSSDLKWVLDQCKRLVEVANACEVNNIKEGDRLLRSNPLIPRMSSGKVNSPRTMCEGLQKNFSTGQRDLTDKQCTGIQEAFRIGNEVINDFDSVTFEEVDQLPKLTAPTVHTIEEGSTFEDLFEIVVTVRRK